MLSAYSSEDLWLLLKYENNPLRRILFETFKQHSNLTTKTFDGNALKMKAASPN